jgi:hypothetical protein
VIGGFIIALPLLLIVLPSMLRLIKKGAVKSDEQNIPSNN